MKSLEFVLDVESATHLKSVEQTSSMRFSKELWRLQLTNFAAFMLKGFDLGPFYGYRLTL